MSRLLIVALGGALGSVARYLLSGVVQSHASSFLPAGTAFFPTGTFVVNVIGCFFVGIFAGLSLANVTGPSTRLFLVVGLCGGFTTFSAFGYETVQLLGDREMWQAGLNVGGQLAAGLVAVWMGVALTRLIWGTV